MADPIITKIEIHTYECERENLGKDYNGFNLVYEPGNRVKSQGSILRIETDQGIVGEYAGGSGAEFSTLPTFVHFLIGRSALQRELFYTEVRRALRQVARIGFAPVDIALWDIAGKLYDQPIYKMLGGYKDSVPCYASTYHGDHQPDGLSSPEAFADFAEHCLELGYPAFKIHGWGRAPVSQEVANVHAVGKRVGDKMDLMLDPACELMTFGDAVKVGWACDENRFFWYEDPYRDGGISQFAHRKLRQLINTPILQTEHVRSLEPHIDFAIADATDYVRGDVGLRRHHRRHKARPRLRSPRHRPRIPRPRPRPAPVHGRHPQHQLLRDGPAPSQGARQPRARTLRRLRRRPRSHRRQRPCLHPPGSRTRRRHQLGLGRAKSRVSGRIRQLTAHHATSTCKIKKR